MGSQQLPQMWPTWRTLDDRELLPQGLSDSRVLAGVQFMTVLWDVEGFLLQEPAVNP